MTKFSELTTTLFKCQIFLAEHRCTTNWGDWGDCESTQIKSNQMSVLRKAENRITQRKTSLSRVENQQTQPTYMYTV